MGQGGNPALYGKNVERRREGDDWNFKFKAGGTEYRGPTYTKDKRKAEAFARQIKAEKKIEVRKDRQAGLGPMTFGAACDAWWSEAGYRNAERGLEYRLTRLRALIGNDTQLSNITPDDVTRVRIERAKDLRRAGKDADGKQLYRPLTPAAVKATLVTLRTVINYVANAKGAAAPRLDWKTWIRKDAEEHDIRVMTESEQALIWPELDDDVREVAEFNLETPKRIGEILSLEWSRVDLVGETIRIKVKPKRKLVDDPIGPLEVARLQRIKQRKLHPTAVFTYTSQRTREYNGVQHTKGERRPMTWQHFYEKWTEACRKVGITDLNPHCLRHTGATRFYWATGDIYTVSKMLNHSSIDTTVRYYARHDPSVVRNLKRRVAEGAASKVSAKASATALSVVR